MGSKMTNIAKLVSVAAAIAVLAFGGPASADEISRYKSQVDTLVSNWGEDALNSAHDIRAAVEEIKSLTDDIAKQSLRTEKLEKEKTALQTEMQNLLDSRRQAVEARDAAQKQHDNAKEKTVGRGVIAGMVDKYNEDIKKLDDQIKKQNNDIRVKIDAIDDANQPIKAWNKKIADAKQRIGAAVTSIQSKATGLSQSIQKIALPVNNDAKLKDKNAKEQHGPELAKYINEKISAEAARRWHNIQANPGATWPQADFVGGKPPGVTVSITSNLK